MRLSPDHAPPEPSARLTFRRWTEADLPLARALWGDARVTALIGGPFDDAWVGARLESELGFQRDHGLQYWPVFLREGGAHVGCCGLRPSDLERGEVELGFHLRPEHWGKAYANEAGAAALRHAFEVLQVEAVVAGHHPENHASKRTIEKLGLVYTHHALYPPTGLQHPRYRITR